MKRTLSLVAILATVMISAFPLMAQKASPHETFSQVVDGNEVTITYGRPYTKSPKTGEVRKIWGGLVPYGKIWRTGADEATVIKTQKPMVIGETTIPAGAYSLFTLPNADGTAKLIFNKVTGQWGVGPGSYDKSKDLAQVDLKKAALDTSVDQFTMAITNAPSGGGIIKLSWEKTEYSVAFTVQK